MLSARLAARSVGDVILAPTTIHQHPLHGAVLRRHLGCARRLHEALGLYFSPADTCRHRQVPENWLQLEPGGSKPAAR